jgi:3-hydroxybutyryl-CoA dehydrogenase
VPRPHSPPLWDLTKTMGWGSIRLGTENREAPTRKGSLFTILENTVDITLVGIIGSGQMGSGIAQVLAQSQVNVILTDVREESLKRAIGSIEKSLVKLSEKGKLQEDPKTILARIQTTPSLETLSTCQVMIEAVNENEEIKKSIFQSLEKFVHENAIIATNTSSLSITRLASFTQKPERFIGMHFMNPVPLMSLVELIRGHRTSDETFASIKSLTEKMGKTPVVVNDSPGFVLNRILIPMINEAFYTLQEGVASAEDIDAAMKLGANHPIGPLALADFIGLDTCLAIMNVLHTGFGDTKYRPCPLLKKYVDAGLLGRKSGSGVYKY